MVKSLSDLKNGLVAELVDALDLGSCAYGVRVRLSSSPPLQKEKVAFGLPFLFEGRLDGSRGKTSIAGFCSLYVSPLLMQVFVKPTSQAGTIDNRQLPRTQPFFQLLFPRQA